MRTLALLCLLIVGCRAPGSDSDADRTPKVLLIGIDGCRPDALGAARTPAIDSLIATGSIAVDAQTCAITSSGPSWSSLLTGVWPAKHGVVDNSFEGARFERYPHVFVHVRQQRPTAYTVSLAHWKPIDEHVVAGADVSRGVDSAQAVADDAVMLLEDGDPDFLFLHLDDVDHAGHASGYSAVNPDYLAAIEETDRLIGLVLDAMRARDAFAQEDWLVLVTTDHGGSGTSHGADVPAHRTIFLVASGGSFGAGELPGDVTIVDAVTTALAHLGIEPRTEWELDGRELR